MHSAGRTEQAGVRNEDHRWGQEGPHLRGLEGEGGAGKEETRWGGSQPSNRAEGGTGRNLWMACIQLQGWAPGGSELGALRGQRLGREGADSGEGTHSQSAQRLLGMVGPSCLQISHLPSRIPSALSPFFPILVLLFPFLPSFPSFFSFLPSSLRKLQKVYEFPSSPLLIPGYWLYSMPFSCISPASKI